MGRLRFAQKFALIGLVLVAALAFTGRAYLRSQDGQIAFSAKERVGLRVVAPAGTLLGRLTALRSTAVRAAGGDEAARDALPEREAAVADGSRDGRSRDRRRRRRAGPGGALDATCAPRSRARPRSAATPPPPPRPTPR